MKLNTSNSPFTEKQVTEINNLLQTLTESQQQWLSGFLLANSNDTTSDSNQQQLETEVWQQSQISEEQETSTTKIKSHISKLISGMSQCYMVLNQVMPCV